MVFRNDIIPVVMGAHPTDYKLVAPENSYIHIEDFESPKELAEYLLYLDSNDDEYNKYFEWKGTGEIISLSYLCRVCAMVHYAELVPPPPRNETFDFGNIEENHLCLSLEQTYWGRNSSLFTMNSFNAFL